MEEFDEINDFFGSDFDGDAEDDIEKTEDEVLNNLLEKENKEIVKKRSKARQQPKLDEATLTSPKGIPALRESFKDYKPDSLLDPYENLNIMLKKYEHWAHVMFPKLKFEDVVSRCEYLGDKRIVKVYMTKSRLDMPVSDEDFAPRRKRENEIVETENNEDDNKSRNGGSDDDENYYDPLEAPSTKKIAADDFYDDTLKTLRVNSNSQEVHDDFLEAEGEVGSG